MAVVCSYSLAPGLLQMLFVCRYDLRFEILQNLRDIVPKCSFFSGFCQKSDVSVSSIGHNKS